MMKKKILVLLILFIIIIIVSTNQCFATTSTGKTFYYKNDAEGILAYKQVNAFQLKLSNGTVLSNMSVNTNSSVNLEENMKDVEIVFILDNSGSMSGTRISTLKTSTNELVNKLFDKIGDEHLKFGFVKFASKQLGALELTNNKASISSFINSMNASGGTYMASSLVTAKTMLTNSGNSDAIKIVITLSDGDLMDESQSINNFKTIHSSNISTISIFVETAITNSFKNLASTSSLHKNMQTTTSNMADTLVNDIYDEIYMKVILLSEPTTILDLNNAGIIPGSDRIILQVDSEILHGATLSVEYVISITNAFDAKNIVIKDFPENSLQYSSSQKLLTENKTNADYGWSYQDGYLYSNSGGNTVPAAQEYKKKLILTTILTSSVLNRSSAFTNYAEFSEDKILDTGDTSSIVADTAQDGGKIRALSFLIIPPTGNSHNYSHVVITNVAIVVFFTCLFILIYLFSKLKATRRK